MNNHHLAETGSKIAIHMFAVIAGAAMRAYPLPYEYRRLGIIGVVTAALFLGGSQLPPSSLPVDLAARSLLWLGLPLILGLLRFFTPAELARIRSFGKSPRLGLLPGSGREAQP